MLSNTLRPLHLNSSLTMLTLPEMEPANTIPQRVLVRSLDSKMLHLLLVVLTNLELPLPSDQSLLPLKPIKLPSKDTLEVSSPLDVELHSTTVSSPSDTEPSLEKTTSSSRTPGELHGEMKDTSRSVLTTSAVSSCNHLTQP